MSKYLADTTILIDHLRGREEAKIFLEKHIPYISIVTVAELIQGSREKRELNIALKLCENFPEININKKISDKATQLLTDFYLSHGLLFLDALIAAAAIENNLILVTGNIKHFIFLKELNLMPQVKAFREI